MIKKLIIYETLLTSRAARRYGHHEEIILCAISLYWPKESLQRMKQSFSATLPLSLPRNLRNLAKFLMKEVHRGSNTWWNRSAHSVLDHGDMSPFRTTGTCTIQTGSRYLQYGYKY